ncbi:MAG TPA: hypothetical protein VGG44_11780 [Tepidisphaeraceae bacterium]|jgi:hypothetical protein
MALDLRFPLGLMFAILGAILIAVGLIHPEQTLGININLWWGIVLLAFGVVMLLLAMGGKGGTQLKSGVVLENPERPH